MQLHTRGGRRATAASALFTFVAIVSSCFVPGCAEPPTSSLSRESTRRADVDDEAGDSADKTLKETTLPTEGETTPEEQITNERPGDLSGEQDGELLEGDIVIDEENTTAPTVAGNAQSSRPWPGGIMHYVVNAQLPNQTRVTDAIAHWQARTGIRFVKRTNEAAYVEFVPGSGCSSSIGRTGRRQTITLASKCSTGAVIHEIGHAAGLWHEQSRSDRDKFVRVHLANVQSGKENNFQKTTFTSFGQYDLGSIMHYGSTFFSANGKPTMTKLDGSMIVPNRSALSVGDIAGIKAIYGNEAVPEPMPAPATTIVLEDLNLRAGPGTNFQVLAVMPNGATVTRTGKSQNGFDSIRYNGQDGWGYATYLSQ